MKSLPSRLTSFILKTFVFTEQDLFLLFSLIEIFSDFVLLVDNIILFLIPLGSFLLVLKDKGVSLLLCLSELIITIILIT